MAINKYDILNVNYFNNSGAISVADLSITSAIAETLYKMRSGTGDLLKHHWVLPENINRLNNISFDLCYTSNIDLNSACIELYIKTISHSNGVIGENFADHIIFEKTITNIQKNVVKIVNIASGLDISNYNTGDVLFMVLKRKCNSGGEIYPIYIKINYQLNY